MSIESVFCAARKRGRLFAGCFVALFSFSVFADETCMSPYMAKIVGQEDYVYVWTLGTPGVGHLWQGRSQPVRGGA